MTNLIGIIYGATDLPEESVAHLSHDITKQSGVVDLDGGDWAVAEHSPANMSVDVASGFGYLKKTIMTYRGYSSAANVVTITANSSGNPRIDSIVAYADLAATPDATASNVLKFAAVAGTPASSPVAPDDTAIVAAIGSGNPYLVLADVAVANGASSITDSEITDQRVAAMINALGGVADANLENVTMKGVKQNHTTNTDGTTVTFDLDKSNSHIVTLGGNRTLAISNPKVNSYFVVHLKQDGTGSRTVTWWSNIDWAGGAAPQLTTTASKMDSFGFFYDGSRYKGYVIGQNI